MARVAAHEASTVRVAAAGDIHCSPQERARVEAAFASLDGDADLVLLAGDLTSHGDPLEAEVLGEVCRGLGIPVFAVLGNHDWHKDRAAEIVAVLEDAGIRVVEGRSALCEVRGHRVGVAGAKGFVGGFPDAALPDFGEPSLRRVYAETTAEVEALDRALGEIEDCDIRIALLHYAPTTSTLGSEPEGIWAFLGSDRLARPILAHRPDLVLHGHAHAGAFEGFVGAVPVYNVALHVTGRDFWIFELGKDRPEARVEAAEPPAA
jgi:Icc-related predicted phosphoesterase